MTKEKGAFEMRILTISLIVCLGAIGAACSSPKTNDQLSTRATPTPLKTPIIPKNGDYPGRGKVTKINNELGSVEINHEEIKDVMTAMQMEFFVSDKALLKGLKVGDEVNFTLHYVHPQETIIAISKIK